MRDRPLQSSIVLKPQGNARGLEMEAGTIGELYAETPSLERDSSVLRGHVVVGSCQYNHA